MLKQETSALSGMRAIKTIMGNKKLRLNLAIETFCVVTCSIVFYSVSFSSNNLGGNKYLNVVYMGILDFFASPASILFTNNLGRRKTFMIYMFGGTIFMTAVVFLLLLNPNVSSTQSTVVALSLCGRFCIVAAWGALLIMIMETSPTNVRATCSGFTTFAGYFGGILAPQLVVLGRCNFFCVFINLYILLEIECTYFFNSVTITSIHNSLRHDCIVFDTFLVLVGNVRKTTRRHNGKCQQTSCCQFCRDGNNKSDRKCRYIKIIYI